METYLCTFINYQQDDWSEKLAIVKFATNNNETVFTKLSPFFASKSLHFYMSFDIVNFQSQYLQADL